MLLAVNVGISSGILFIPCHYLLHVKISLFWKISSRYISGIGRKARYIGRGEQSNQSIKKKKKKSEQKPFLDREWEMQPVSSLVSFLYWEMSSSLQSE